MNNLFARNNDQEVVNGANQLEKTAQLTTQAMSIANQMMKAIDGMPEDQQPAYADMITSSMKDHDAMDELIELVVNLDNEDIAYLQEETESTLDKMIKSQQSKRSRSKGKVMTLDNYKTMLTGAIAENLLRIAANKPKSTAGSSAAGITGYSVDELTKLSMNKEELAKAIRNIQSKKSIAKSKAGFTVDSDKWQQLLIAEAQLKALRDGAVTQKTIADSRITKIEEALKDVGDPATLKAPDAKALLAMMLEIINPTSESTVGDNENN